MHKKLGMRWQRLTSIQAFMFQLQKLKFNERSISYYLQCNIATQTSSQQQIIFRVLKKNRHRIVIHEDGTSRAGPRHTDLELFPFPSSLQDRVP